MKNSYRIGVFDTSAAAERAVQGLLEAGFARESLSVICPDCADGVASDVRRQDPAGANTPAAALAGGSLGALLGGVVAAAGIAATGGTGLLVAGPLLAGGAAGAVGGSFVGAMLTRGFEPETADYYDQALQRGKVLVAVENPDSKVLERAEAALLAAGAEPVHLTAG